MSSNNGGSLQIGTNNNKITSAVPATSSTANTAAQQTSNLLSNIERANFKDSIMIHVIDDSKNEKRDFTFSRSLLVKYMKYFDKCLKKISDQDEIDISIHCDAVIFEWLLNYIFSMEEYEKKQGGNKNSGASGWQLTVQKCEPDSAQKKSAIQSYNGPKLDIKNAVTILISADFLKIDRLVKECLDFFVEHIEEISKVQVDMGCINSQIIREMARKVSLDRLNVLKERKDKLVSRLFMKKLELLLEKERNYLYKCAYCNKLFTMSQRKVLDCPKAKTYIDYNGQIRAKHVVDRSWDLKKFVTFVRETYRISWREIYWKVWSYLQVFKCERCNEYYHISELGNCHVHKQAPKVKMSLHGPLGSNYVYSCCNKEISVTSILNQCQEPQNGCEVQVHEISETFMLDQSKEKKITDRIIAHQLIILENTGPKYIDQIIIKEFNPDSKEPTSIRLTEGTGQQPSSLVRPSSLNYKISLSEAVSDFIKKDMPTQDDQYIDVQAEEPKVGGSNNQTSNGKNNNQQQAQYGEAFDELDDVMFDMTGPNTKNQGNAKGSKNHPQTPAQQTHGNYYVNENGQTKDAWFRDEEIQRKKLEKSAINQLKSRIAQQNRQAGSSKAQPPPQDDNNDSDMEPPNKDDSDTHGGSNNAVVPTQVQLNPQQIEEAKQMTYGKMRQFRRDRLYASDRDRLGNLADMLKKSRIPDDQQACHLYNWAPGNPSNGNGGSPNKTSQGKNWEHGKSSSPQKISPTKQQQNSSKYNNDNSHTNNGQVMTQISAIYSKRSRSILNQFNQTNIGHNNHAVHGNHNNANTHNNYLSPNQNINQGRGSVGNDHEHGNNPNKGSPRLGRLRGISPQSREKGYNTGNNVSSTNASGNMNYSQNMGHNNNIGGANHHGHQGVVMSSSNHSNHPSYTTSTNHSVSTNVNTNSGVGGMVNSQSNQNDHLHHGLPGSHLSHADRINHSSPNKPASGSAQGVGAIGVGIGAIGSSGVSIQGSGNNGRPTMNHTSHGKNFPYSMHRKTNSNKLPHIGSSHSKDGSNQQSTGGSAYQQNRE